MRAGWNEASRIGLKIKKSLKRREKSSGRDMESIEGHIREKNWRGWSKRKVIEEERNVLVEIWRAFKSSREKNWTE